MAKDQSEGGIRWGAEQRLEFIEFRSFWEGGLNRSDITDRFGVSVPQASNDLTQYRSLAPDNLFYDASAKRYRAAYAFRPRFLDVSAEKYLSQLRARAEGVISLEDTWIGMAPDALAMPVPSRRVGPDLLRQLLAIMRARTSIEVCYQSMSPLRPDPIWRRTTPHAFGSDGLRWHVRGYCHIDGVFKDFVLSRWRDVRNEGPPGADPAADRDWRDIFEVILEPNPALSEGQREAVAWEYDMPEGCASLPVRMALLYYLKKRLRLDNSDDSPAETPVVVANRAEFEQALASATGHVA